LKFAKDIIRKYLKGLDYITTAQLSQSNNRFSAQQEKQTKYIFIC